MANPEQEPAIVVPTLVRELGEATAQQGGMTLNEYISCLIMEHISPRALSASSADPELVGMVEEMQAAHVRTHSLQQQVSILRKLLKEPTESA